MKRLIVSLIIGVACLLPAFAQNRTTFAGESNAFDFAYGIPGAFPPALTIIQGNTVTGAGTVQLQTGFVTLSDGTVLCPLNVNAPVVVGNGPGAETVTPTAVSCGIQNVPNSATITATFANLHGGDSVSSSTFGLQEALNYRAGIGGGIGGGDVAIDPSWAFHGGSNALIAAAAPYSAVSIRDNRAAPTGWSMQPSTLTDLATPATRTGTTIVFTASPVGTWAASATYFCVTYVDALGGESPCSATYNQTPTVNYTLNATSPVASTGAVGWRMYAGTSAVTSAYLLPITSASCTLTTLETVMPACAIGSNGVWPATFVSTTSLAPGALGVTSTSNPVPQGHTTFAYAPNGLNAPQPFQTNYGPFGTGTIASATASALTPLGSFELPTAFLNTIGRTIRVSGKVSLTAGASSTLAFTIGATWAGGVTAGAPVTVCNPISGFVFATHAYTDVNFSCTMTTNAVGTTAVGSIMPDSMFMAGYAAGTLIPIGTDNSAAAIGSLGLFSQNEFTVFLAPLVAADTTVQMQSLHIEVLQ